MHLLGCEHVHPPQILQSYQVEQFKRSAHFKQTSTIKTKPKLKQLPSPLGISLQRHFMFLTLKIEPAVHTIVRKHQHNTSYSFSVAYVLYKSDQLLQNADHIPQHTL